MKIVKIEPIENIITYDLEIEKNHNYVANNLIVHNSTVSRLIKSINPDCFDDIVAITSINRPGPLEAFSEVFGKWKRWEKEHNDKELLAIEEERYPFEFMREPLKKTYGCLLFQESFMLMVVAAAGFTMGEADSFRRAIAWKEDHPKYYTVKKYFNKLADGMKCKGYSDEDVKKFIEYCRRFMGYAFNKCLTKNHKIISQTRGEINILDVEIGEKILGYNSNLKKDEYNEVINKYNNGKKDVFEIELETGEKFECTMKHKFLTKIGMLSLKEVISKNLEIKIKNICIQKLKT